MTVETKKIIKRFSLTVLIFSSFYGILASLYYIGEKNSEKRIISAITQTIQENKLSIPFPETMIKIENAGFSYVYTFIPNKQSSVQGIYYLVRVTGNAGPYACLFFNTKNDGTIFIGCLGISGFVEDAQRYGLTSRVISSWLLRLSTLSENYYQTYERAKQ